MNACIVYLASPTAWKVGVIPKQVRRYDALRYSLSTVRPLFPTTPIYVFHEDYTEEDKDGLSFAVNDFFQIDFSGCGDVYRNVNGPKGYMMMCRFFSGVLQSHPVLQKHTHYIRFDDDSYLTQPFLTETRIQSYGNIDYAMRSVFYESKSQQTLFDFTFQFLRKMGMTEIDGLWLKQSLRNEKFLKGDVYTGKAPYNNFHVSSLSLWKHPIVSRYIQAIETVHGCLSHGWLDANIHAMIIWVIAKRYKNIVVRLDTEFGYRHNIHVSLLNSQHILVGDGLQFMPSMEEPFSETYTLPNTCPNLLDTGLGIQYPWYTFPFLKELSTWKVSSWRVFEYGGGGSTEWWRRKAREVVSVDNDPVWAKRYTIFLETDHDTYIHKPIEVGGLFDCIVIDGLPVEWRDDCTEIAYSCLKPGGIIIIDNYHQPSSYLGEWPKTDTFLESHSIPIHTFKQQLHKDWKTIYFQKPYLTD
jgi:hypothetical protein